MKNLFFRNLLIVLLTGSWPLVPAVAQASVGAGLTADTGVAVSAGASTTLDTQPIVITRSDIEATSGTSSTQGTDTKSEKTGARSATASSSLSADLRARAESLVAADAKVSSVMISPQQVSLSYLEPAKFLGFVSVEVPVTVTVGSTGDTTVKYPWYNFLLVSHHSALAARAHAAVGNAMAFGKGNATTTFSASVRAHLLDSLYAVLQNESTIGSSTGTSTSVSTR